MFTKMLSLDISILIARRSRMWKSDNQDINDLDLCQCHLFCDNLGNNGQSGHNRRAKTVSLNTISVAKWELMGADGRRKRREG
jgi:hypothetical protein